MNSEQQNKLAEKKKLFLVTLASLAVMGVIIAAGMFVLSKIKNSENQPSANSQEQFAGQVETSQQLQSECQSSAVKIVQNDNLQQAADEFKKHFENCKEVYFSIEEKSRYRNEGMYPDLSIDLLSFLTAENKAKAFEFLNYLKTLSPWQYYMGPIVCESKNVIAAYEESLKSASEKLCVKPAEFKTQILNEIKAKNFSVLERTLSLSSVAWLGSPEADAGCPDKISAIIKTAKQATEGAVQVKESNSPQETNDLSIVFSNKSDEDKLVLVFGEANGCVQLKSALVSGLQSN